jgi:hypothetical protein
MKQQKKKTQRKPRVSRADRASHTFVFCRQHGLGLLLANDGPEAVQVLFKNEDGPAIRSKELRELVTTLTVTERNRRKKQWLVRAAKRVRANQNKNYSTSTSSEDLLFFCTQGGTPISRKTALKLTNRYNYKVPVRPTEQRGVILACIPTARFTNP